MAKWITYSLLFSGCMLWICSCKKKCDQKPPVVTIVQPTEGQTVQLPDSVTLAGNASDDNWLSSLHITVLNLAGDTVFAEQPEVYGAKQAEFIYHFYTQTAGTYQLKVTAIDGDQAVSSGQVQFAVN